MINQLSSSDQHAAQVSIEVSEVSLRDLENVVMLPCLLGCLAFVL